jgi:hypothetical protein
MTELTNSMTRAGHCQSVVLTIHRDVVITPSHAKAVKRSLQAVTDT